jgi:hypothetical protein
MYDNNLVLDAGQTITVDAQTTEIEVEGGVFAFLKVDLGTIGGSADLLDIRLQHQADGSNWRTCPGGRLETIDSDDEDDVHLCVPVFIPLHDTKGSLTPVRIDYDVTEADAASFVIENVRLEAMIPAPLPGAVDLAQSEGLYYPLVKQ